MDTYDAIIIGAGHNGLVTALYLARAGWKTLVLERNAQIGGAVQSGAITRPGFVHDLWSTNQNLFRGSPVYKELKADLERHGLQYVVSDKPYCNVFPDGSSLRVYKDQERTLALLQAHNAADADGWRRLYAQYKQFTKTLLPLYGVPLPSPAAAWVLVKALLTAGPRELGTLAGILLSSTRELGETYFASPEARALIATWGMHLDFGPSVSGGATFPFLEAFTDMEQGMALAQGGASKMPEALAGLLREYGGTVRTEAPVRRIRIEGDHATGVILHDGTEIAATRAVIANLTPGVLFGDMLADYPLPLDVRRRVKAYKYGPGTMMVHLALREPPQWAAGPEISEFAYVHIPPTVDDLDRTYTQSLAGLLPDSPLLIVGQTSVVDPSRVPGHGAILWIQVRTLPNEIRGDAAGAITARTWDDAKEAYADRVIAKLEQYAPGIRDLILERVVYSPTDLAHANPNLVGGDSVGGSHHLRQNFLWRPWLGASTYTMPVRGLYMVGAGTWPGAGTNGTSGYLAAQALLAPPSARSVAVTTTAAAITATALIGLRWWRAQRRR